MERRKLDRRELSLVLWAMEYDSKGELRKGAQLHVVRQLVGGGKIWACEASKAIAEGAGISYYTFPMLDFMLQNAPICPRCHTALVTEGIIPDRTLELS